jgi:hypothetical protein
MSSYVLVGPQPGSSRVSDILLAVLRMEPPSTQHVRGLCVLPGLTATSKVTLVAVLQLSVALGMAVVIGGVLGVQAVCRAHGTGVSPRAMPPGPRQGKQGQGRQASWGPQVELLVAHAEEEEEADTGRGAGTDRGADMGRGAGDYVALEDDGPGPSDLGGAGASLGPPSARSQPGAPPRTLRARLITAAVNFSLTAYATLAVAATKMLHCVWVPGTPPASRRLFIRGTLECGYGGWQAPYVIVLGVLAAVPLCLPLVARWARGTGDGARGVRDGALDGGCCQVWGRGSRGPPQPPSQLLLDVRDGVRRALVDAYSKEWPWWESVLMVQRLVGGPWPLLLSHPSPHTWRRLLSFPATCRGMRACVGGGRGKGDRVS